MRNSDKFFQQAISINKICSKKFNVNVDEIIEYFRIRDPLFEREIDIRKKCSENEYLIRFENKSLLADIAFITLNILRSIKRKINTYEETDLETFKKRADIRRTYEKSYTKIKTALTKNYMINGNGLTGNFSKMITVYDDKLSTGLYDYVLLCKPVLSVKSDEIIEKLKNGIKTTWESPRNLHKITQYNYIYFVIMEQKGNIHLYYDELNIRRISNKIVVKGYDVKSGIGHSQPLLDFEGYSYEKVINMLILSKIR